MKSWIKNQIALFALVTGVLCTPVICYAQEQAELIPVCGTDIADGIYEVSVESSSSMFRVVKADLKVSEGKMAAELTLSGKGYLYLFMGTAKEAAAAEEKEYIPFGENEQGAYVYTIPVEALNQKFDCAAYSKRKEKWYDRQLMIPVDSLGRGALSAELEKRVTVDTEPVNFDKENGDYTIEAILSGGSGRGGIETPVQVSIMGKNATARLVWSSPYYDYILFGGRKYYPVNTEGNSVFEIPIIALDEEILLIADTVAMSKPHEVEYTITFQGDTLRKKGFGENGLLAVGVALVVITAIVIKKRSKRKGSSLLLILLLCFLLTGCGIREKEAYLGEMPPEISSTLVYKESMELQYADQFAIDYYENGYVLIRTVNNGQYLVVPKGKRAPEDLAENVKVLQQPLQNIYLAASAAMDMICGLGEVDAVRFSGQREENWCIQEAIEAMEQGQLLYAGKYNMPDYELILSKGCSLAIENNMISHSPEVIEKLESFDIPVLVDFSSYESHPFGRVEWIKLYGVLLDKRETAEDIFEEQCEILKRMSEEESFGKTVAFFYITNNGMVNVRCSSDYVPKMIELAGGKYIFDDLDGKKGKRSSATIQMEEFYHVAKEADYLIYNSIIDGGVHSMEELLQKDRLLQDFKAVQDGKVWCTTKDLYQQPLSIGKMIEDIHYMMTDDEKQQNNISGMYLLE